MANVPKGFGSVDDLIKRFSKAAQLRELWRSLHQEASEYCAPNRETFSMYSPGQKKNSRIFDSTGVDALSKFSNKIQATLMPPWRSWLDLVAGDEVGEEDKDRVSKGLENVTKILFDNINHSNFYTEISPSLMDLGIGTGAIIVEEEEFGKSSRLKFTSVPLSEVYPEKPPGGGAIESGWRKQKIAPHHIQRVWAKADLPDELKKLAKKQDAEDVEILHGMLFNPEDGQYHQLVIYVPTKTLLFTQSFETKRLIIWRWEVTPGEAFGRGPAIKILPDIRTINKVKEFMLKNAALQIAGVYTGVSDGVFNPHTVRISPGTIIPVKSNNTANLTLRALERSGDLQLGQFVIEDMQDAIRKAFFVEPFGDVTDPVRSATEIQLRNQEMLMTAGASFGRQITELIEPLIAAVMDILKGLGQVPDIKVDGKEVTIKQSSPLAKAEQLDDFQNSQVWFQAISALPPEVIAASVKVEDLPGFWSDQLGVSKSLIRSAEERQQLASQIQEAAQEQIQQPQGQGGIQ